MPNIVGIKVALCMAWQLIAELEANLEQTFPVIPGHAAQVRSFSNRNFTANRATLGAAAARLAS